MIKYINKEIQVLDKGFVRIVDTMGNDNAIVRSARVSYSESSKGEEQDKKLINYLIKNHHTSPLEHCTITLHIKAPLFVVAQWVRHRCWSYNFISYRYTEPTMEFYEPKEWRGQSTSNKQMSNGVVKEISTDNKSYFTQEILSELIDWYNKNVENGMSREMARMALPQNLYTEFYATVDLHNLLHFIKLRDHEHAQQEIRDYAKVIRELLKQWVPWTLEAFEEHVLHSYTLSQKEIKIVLNSFKLNNLNDKTTQNLIKKLEQSLII